MKKQILLSFMTIAIFILVACSGLDLSKLSDKDLERITDKAIQCNKPYIRVGTNCCLDQNYNSICDTDEQQKSIQNMEVKQQEVKIEDKKDLTKQPQMIIDPEYDKRIEEQKKAEEEKRIQEQVQLELKKRVEEERKLAEQKRIEEERKKQEEQKRKEQEKLEEEKRKTQESKSDLSNYPAPFMKDGVFDGMFVMSNNEPNEQEIVDSEVSLATSISLVLISGQVIQVDMGGLMKWENEIVEPDANNLIIVGTTCASRIIQSAYNNPNDCKSIAPAGKGLIELLKKGDKYKLVVTGRTYVEVQKAVNYLLHYFEKSMSGTKIEVP